MIRILCLAASFGFLSTAAVADNWAHWRGNGNGVSTTATPPTQWGPNQNVKWKTPIPGRGSGSPIVWENQVFVVTAVDAEGAGDVAEPASDRPARDGQAGGRRGRGGRRGGDLKTLDFKLICIDRANGKVLWEKTAITAKPHEGTHNTNGFASASPCTDGQHVYAHFGSRGLYCFTMDGELVWKRDDLGKMNCRAGFGEGSSPTIVENMIVVPWDHEGPSYITALNKLTGETIWKTPRDEPTCWATPLLVEAKGQRQIVMNGQTSARGYDLKGNELWRCAGQTDRPVASAVQQSGTVFIGSGYRGSFLGAFDITGRGDLAGTSNVVWSVNRDTPDIASPLLSDGRLYYTKAKTGTLTCVDAATGQPHYSTQRIRGLNTLYASPIAAGGHVYITGRSGTTVVISDSQTFQLVAENSVGEGVDATPAPVDQELFIRGERHLFCISE